MVAARQWGTRSWVMLGSLVAAFILCAAAVLDAVRLDAVSIPAPVSDQWTLTPPPAPKRADISPAVVLTGVTKDPFRPDRKRPPHRYRLPGERRAELQNRAAVPPLLTRIRLLGTVVAPGGRGVAAFQVPGRPPRVLRVGHVLEGFELTSVERGMATLVGPDTTLVLRLPGALQGEQR